MKDKILAIAFLGVMGVVAVALPTLAETNSLLVPSNNLPYGGQVLGLPLPCTCGGAKSTAFLIVLGPPSAGTYLFDRSKLKNSYPYFAFLKPLAFHLGFYQPAISQKNPVSGKLGPPTCPVGVPPACVLVPITRGTIVGAGTSL